MSYKEYLDAVMESVQKSGTSYVIYYNDADAMMGFNETIGEIAKELAKEFESRYNSEERTFSEDGMGVEVTLSFKSIGEEDTTLGEWHVKKMAQLRNRVPGRNEDEIDANLVASELSDYDIVREIDQLNYWWKDIDYTIGAKFVSRKPDTLTISAYLLYDQPLPSKAKNYDV
jgi:hypothetical protein